MINLKNDVVGLISLHIFLQAYISWLPQCCLIYFRFKFFMVWPFFLINSFFGAYAACLCKSKIIIITIFKFLSWGVKTPTHVLLYPNSSFWVSRALISLRASLGRQKFLISSSRRATARLSTRAKLSLSKKGSKGPRVSRAVPSICPSDREEPCGARHTERDVPDYQDFTLKWLHLCEKLLRG